MSGAKVLDFGATAEFGNLAFSDLASRLEQQLANIRSLTDLESLIGLMNPLLKDERFTVDEQTLLKRLRQRAYDRKRRVRFKTPNPSERKSKTKEMVLPNILQPKTAEAILFSATKNMMPPERVAAIKPGMEIPAIQMRTDSFRYGITRAFSRLDGEHFITTAPKIVAWLIAASTVSFFMWQQSLDLYESAGFANGNYAAIGGLIMVVGFAAYHAITRSWIALLFCLYAGAYESYLMVYGTINDDKQATAIAIKNDPELVFLQENADKEKAHYHELKQRYDDPESKVFKNDWFAKLHLNPAWGASTKTHDQFVAKKSALLAAANSEHVTWLKVFYRLGLVVLCMMMVHRFFTCCVGNRILPL